MELKILINIFRKNKENTASSKREMTARKQSNQRRKNKDAGNSIFNRRYFLKVNWRSEKMYIYGPGHITNMEDNVASSIKKEMKERNGKWRRKIKRHRGTIQKV